MPRGRSRPRLHGQGRAPPHLHPDAWAAFVAYARSAAEAAQPEAVMWLPRRRASDIALPGNDFWLFDGRLVRWNQENPIRVRIVQPSGIALHLKAFGHLRQLAVYGAEARADTQGHRGTRLRAVVRVPCPRGRPVGLPAA
ncbi:DUF6879 family protein [Streptomyces sp. B22F1]|uniref:DUF6879 family protein n=1 Tax=Streptomyces sp. B22F1 TaxID=3153566 RepID=UPI00325E06F1